MSRAVEDIEEKRVVRLEALMEIAG